MMKNLIKKLKPFIKRSSAFVAALLVLVCSFITPSFAADFTDDPTGKNMLVPLWEIDGLKITYTDGSVSLFEFPSRWWSDSDSYSNGIVIDSSDGVPGLSLDIYGVSISPYVDAQYQYALSFEMDTTDMSTIEFLFSDTFIPYTLFDGNNKYIYGVSVSSDNLFSDVTFSGRYNFAYPALYKHTGTEATETISGRSLVSYGGRSLSGYPVGTSYVLTPHTVDFDDEAGGDVGIVFDSAFYPPQYDKHLYYYDMSASLNFTSNVDSLRFTVPLIDPSNRLDFFEWSKLYFPSYNFDYSSDELSELGTFLANSLGAFVNFQIFPGFKLGTVLFAVFGMSMFLLFVKYFAK